MHERAVGRVGIAARNYIQHAGYVFATEHDLRETRTLGGIVFIAVKAHRNHPVMSEEIVFDDAIGVRGACELRERDDLDPAQLQSLYCVSDFDVCPCSGSWDPAAPPNVGIVLQWILAPFGMSRVRIQVPPFEDVRILKACESKESHDICRPGVRLHTRNVRYDALRAGFCSFAEDRRNRD